MAHVSGVLLLLIGSVASAQETLRTHVVPRWVGTWEAPMASSVDNGCIDCTIRDVIHLSAGGTAVRVRLSNAFGTAPLPVEHTTVALPAIAGGADVAPGMLREVTFGGRAAVTIAPGAEAVSDPVRLAVPAGGDLLVTTYTPGYATPMSYHPVALQRSFFLSGADEADATTAGAFPDQTFVRHFVSGVDVSGPPGAIVTFGDSITDGYRSTESLNRRWPDVLAGRLLRGPASRRFGVLNAGIGGNRVLRDGGTHGPSAARRFDRDVLSRSGVRTVILLEGINDIQEKPHEFDPTKITAELADLAARSRAHGLRVIGGTLTPFKGCICYSLRGEATRQAVNAWIRRSGVFDSVIDFDAALRDPSDPDRMLPAFDSGDHLHPGDAGYEAMGWAVDLSTL
ncbi:SGNH/GDSL hydrolase family protein [Actinomadura sp. DC4]|uniref:SGNH/GDSL hydrolase family protein n=1 Tax=Actinomadura sp. DC4 TaxID=3055069 RepID=UPI0025AFF555|nr:SGNH/GDSL hydrolase family protein [Actinomadura sp. DC4]MDN3359591.1 SGNH/GDSL hydrolase family protein [Actinomadura sp. DC4]